MACGVCGALKHNAVTCPYNAKRIGFSSTNQKSKRCECCGQAGYSIERHHTKGRGNNSDYLDVCKDCHLECGHQGHFQNLPIKPRVCRILNRESYWRQ